jgi:endo-1,4-beta-xylanase
MNELAKEVAKNILLDDPEIEFRIAQGIELNRKGFARLELTSPDGKPVERAEVTYQQVRHEYRFGCNAFMLEQFNEPEKNRRYEEIFAGLFNLAVVPFYWSDLEPEDGNTRFRKDSRSIYRRPPPDLVLEFCERNRITPKGHPLYWHELVPSWVPTNRQDLEARMERRIREIAERYTGKINIWDVVNEAIQWEPFKVTMPEGHVEKAFRMAQKYFPESAELLINEGPWVSWESNHGDYTPLYMLVRHLLQSGLPVKGVGLQYHMAFREPAEMVKWGWQYINSRRMFDNLDQYAKLGLPVNVSEITITAHEDFGDGNRFQELVAEKLYRIWFSHGSTNGIIYWNLADNTANCNPENINSWCNENKFRGGLLNFDLTPKPAYNALRDLIKKEWTSSGTVSYENGKVNVIHGFYGEYELKVKTNTGTFTKIINHSKNAKTTHEVELR